MKKNGFTLIEILGVVTLLSLISVIIIISINSSLKESQEIILKEQIEEIKTAASMWRTDNIEQIEQNSYYTITLQQLQNQGYIKEDIINPKTNQKINKNTQINIALNDIIINIQ